MHEAMRHWSAPPGLQTAVIEEPGLRIRSRHGLDQWLVSGHDAAACRSAGIETPAVGALGIASGSAYAIRMARERVLLVGEAALPLEAGWIGDGYLASPMSAALHVFELEGLRVTDVVRRACVIDPGAPGPCAAVSFAGITAALYRLGDAGPLRLHVDRGLAPYIWDWLGTACGLMREGSPIRA